MKFEAGTAEDLERALIEQAGFTLSAAKEIARIAGLTDEDTFAGDRANVTAISSSAIVMANVADFRGVGEPDSGTAFEIGFAAALGKDV